MRRVIPGDTQGGIHQGRLPGDTPGESREEGYPAIHYPGCIPGYTLPCIYTSLDTPCTVSSLSVRPLGANRGAVTGRQAVWLYSKNSYEKRLS